MIRGAISAKKGKEEKEAVFCCCEDKDWVNSNAFLTLFNGAILTE
jgi:hypothetical protein